MPERKAKVMKARFTIDEDKAIDEVFADKTRLALVYQVGIANVFAVKCWNQSDYGREARRVYQGDFRTAEAMCRGAALTGAQVASFHCNKAGDIKGQDWNTDIENAVFSDNQHPVFNVVSHDWF